jgi:hypothetical protein
VKIVIQFSLYASVAPNLLRYAQFTPSPPLHLYSSFCRTPDFSEHGGIPEISFSHNYYNNHEEKFTAKLDKSNKFLFFFSTSPVLWLKNSVGHIRQEHSRRQKENEGN